MGVSHLESGRSKDSVRKKQLSMRNSPTNLQQEKQNKKGESCSEGCTAFPRNNRLKEVSSGYRRVVVP